MNYDLVIIGDEEDGIELAISAAASGRSVAVVSTPDSSPSLETMGAAAENVVGRPRMTLSAWRSEVLRLQRLRRLEVDAKFERLGIERICGQAQFLSPTAVEVCGCDGCQIVSSDDIVLNCGTKSWAPISLGLDEQFVVDVESLLRLENLPQSIVIVGGGDTGLKSAIMLARLGVEVVVVDEHATLLELCGLFDATFDAVCVLNIAFRLGEEAIGTELRPDLQVAVRLASGRELIADAVLVCVGCQGKTESLDLDTAGVGVDERDRVWCDAYGQTWNPRITAVGAVMGFRPEAISNSGRENLNPDGTGYRPKTFRLPLNASRFVFAAGGPN